MSRNYYLAVDIGASSGRHMVSWMEDGKMQMEEVYRFQNGMVQKDGKRLWDTKSLFKDIVAGMKAAKEAGYVPTSMSIDTWAVDYVLLDENDEVLGDTYGYRDHRTEGVDEEVYKVIPEEKLYERSGIQKQIFNTIYQLYADKLKRPEVLEKAKTFLMLPDYFQFLLTGRKKSEYTNGSSTQLVNPNTKQWDFELIDMLGLPKEIFLTLQMPGTALGRLTPKIQKEVGFDCEVIMCASHDTASAVMAMPKTKEGIYLSSGTWSLMGVELLEALRDSNSHAGNYTNEGGYDYRFRYLKNIMGLWMIQSVRHELDDKYSFAEICEEASKCDSFPSRVDVNDASFLAPESMIDAIKDYCKNTNQKVPETLGEISTVVYQSLAECYGKTVSEVEKNTKKEYERIYIIGGGANAGYLNELTAKATGKEIYAGPTEATAIGNIMAQMIANKELKDLTAARKTVRESFEIKVYK
ncbi:MAG: rhamnulokinase [Lachnospiraceae bacterium]|nr:rhamnulokinase [Lachnospiraceae bacterium]